MASIEALAALSGTIGWIALVGVTGAIFAAELDMAVAREIYADPDAVVAYAGATNGTLTSENGQFVLSGQWDLASGLSHAAWIAAGCRIGSEPDGSAAVAIVPARDCTTSLSWEPIGLSGTGTGTVSIRPGFRSCQNMSSQTRPMHPKAGCVGAIGRSSRA